MIDRTPEVVIDDECEPVSRLAFRFTPATVRGLIPPNTPGVYCLFDSGQPIYVGRSDRCLRSRLVTHNHRGRASHVIWEATRSRREAFFLESWWWHQHVGSLINKIHPASVAATRCPFCDPAIEAGLAHALNFQPAN